MERLTKHIDGETCFLASTGETFSAGDIRAAAVNVLLDRLATYEDAEEAGLLVRLPCKVGTTVYRLQYVDNEEMPGFFKIGIVATKFSIYLLSEYGKTVFLHREEAEAALVKEV